MSKLWLIFEREYISRVKKRSFILITILTPLSIGVFILIVSLIFSYNNNQGNTIAVIDQGHFLETNKGVLDSTNNNALKLVFISDDLEAAKEKVKKGEYDGVLVTPALKSLDLNKYTILYYSDDQLGMEASSRIEDRIGDLMRDYKIKALQIDKNQLNALSTDIEIDPEPISESGEDTSPITTYVAAAIGGVLGFIMYMTVLIYGMMVMRSVMEEKINRVVEIVISSVKPFQLMLGKILGVGAVGLTQIAIWSVLLPVIVIIVQLAVGVDPAAFQDQIPQQASEMPEMAVIEQLQIELARQNWWLIMPMFALYFFGGFLLYASLFAAIGSAMSDDMGESQGLTLPVTIPVILALYIMMATIDSPNSGLAVFGSLFPLFSPVVMPARLPFHPPAWQVILSMLILIGTVLFFIWLAGRIYRTGILMYGKKVTFKELGKWMFYKG